MPGCPQFQICKNRRYFFAKHRHRKWFGHIIRAADFIALEHIALLIIGCDKDDIGMLTTIPDFFTQIQSAAIGEVNIQQCHIKFIFPQLPYRTVKIKNRNDLISIRGQIVCQCPIQKLIVLYN